MLCLRARRACGAAAAVASRIARPTQTAERCVAWRFAKAPFRYLPEVGCPPFRHRPRGVRMQRGRSTRKTGSPAHRARCRTLPRRRPILNDANRVGASALTRRCSPLPPPAPSGSDAGADADGKGARLYRRLPVVAAGCGCRSDAGPGTRLAAGSGTLAAARSVRALPQVGTFRVCPVPSWSSFSGGHTRCSVEVRDIPLYLQFSL